MTTIFDEVKSSISIVDVILDEVGEPGDSRIILCPFHDDTKPSLSISPDLQVFKCFACGATGDSIKFIQMYKNMPATEAAKYITDKYALDIEIKEDPNEYYYKVQASKMSGYAASVTDKHFEYLKGRGIDVETAMSFGIGGDDSYIHLPIRNDSGRIVGINSRLIVDDPVKTKYIHSAASPIFDKSKILPGVYESKKFASDSVMVVEGQLDMLSCHQAGYAAVACLTNHLSTNQVSNLVSKYATIVLCFDSDGAGAKGTLDAYEKIKAASPHTVVKVGAILGKDPNEHFMKTDKMTLVPIYYWADHLLSEQALLKLLSLEPSHIELRRAAKHISIMQKVKEDDVFHDILMYKKGL